MKRSGGNGEGGAFELLVRARLRSAIGGMVTQGGIADAGKFIGRAQAALLWLVRCCTSVAQVRRPSRGGLALRARAAARNTARAPWVSNILR